MLQIVLMILDFPVLSELLEWTSVQKERICYSGVCVTELIMRLQDTQTDKNI